MIKPTKCKSLAQGRSASGGRVEAAYFRVRGLQASQKAQSVGILAFSLLRGQAGRNDSRL